MAFSYIRTRKQISRLGLLLVGASLLLSIFLSACGSSSTTGTTSTTNDLNLITAGTLTIGSDTTYPPQEFIDTTSGKATGFDVDLITEIAKRMGLKANVVTANFNTIIDDLSAKRYDVVISAVTINDDRKKKADFVPYFNAGESLLVQKGNPKNLKAVADLCGLNVGVQDGTVELDDLNAGSKACTAAGKSEIKLTVLKDQTAVVQLLVTGRVDATYQDSPVTDYYNKLNPGKFDVGGSVVNAAAEGIAIKKGNTALLNAVQNAFNAIKADGTYDKFFQNWGLSDSQKITFVDRRTVNA